MGTSIELCIGDVSLSYSKNHMGIDYGILFQDGDLKRRKSEQINYEYYAENQEDEADLISAEETFVRPLSRIVPRLNLLGHTLDAARNEYQSILLEANEFSNDEDFDELKKEYLTFEEFCDLACRYPIAELANDYIDYNTPDRDVIAKGRLASDEDLFDRIPNFENDDFYWSEASYFSNKVCILSAESMLQIFGLNSSNLETEVTWQFGPIVSAGWVSRDSFQAGTRQKQRILIATEGTSDARIIRRALDALRPDVADFFKFVDVNESHPFWGTGQLVKFAEGLLRIDLLNKVLFVFDNDAEGVDAYRKLQKLNLPANMRAMLLPELEDFRSFRTIGPEGENFSDINGRAAAIECYLDLSFEDSPYVRWSNYKKDIDAWHGALEFKETYSKHFYNNFDLMFSDGSYDASKLRILIDHLVKEATLVGFAV